MTQTIKVILTALLATMALQTASAQTASTGRVESVVVHGAALEGNLNGDSPDRDVFVYLPPGYDDNDSVRYPVVYFLHGFGDPAERMKSGFTIEADANAAMAGESPAVNRMIIVNPSAYTRFGHSIYSSSAAGGDWERFIADDLVTFVDSHYRTLPTRESRGIAGHSVGAYGTWRIGMKRPDVFSALYSLSSGGMMETGELGEVLAAAEKVTTPEQISALPMAVKSVMARSAAWSANPQRPPFYFDLPAESGVKRLDIQAKWMANSIIPLLGQHVFNLKRYTAIQFDVGTADGFLAQNRQLDAALTQLGITHTFETYEGDHNNRIAERTASKLLPFFSVHLQRE